MREKAGAAEAGLGVDDDKYDSNELSQVGWGVIFAPGLDQKIKDALDPLIKKRKKDVGDDDLFKVFDDFEPGDTAAKWLVRNGADIGTSVVEPLDGVPYYILIVAPPTAISFEFQYELDLNWAVGRIWFRTADEFRQYADSVVQYEEAQAPPTSRQVVFFAPENENDLATYLLNKNLAPPLLDGTTLPNGRVKDAPLGEVHHFKPTRLLGDYATTDALDDVLRGKLKDGTPALLFTGSHGKSSSISDPEMENIRGALICAGWARGGDPPTPDELYTEQDLKADAKVHGMIHFMFACYGVGWPQFDTYGSQEHNLIKNYVRMSGGAVEISPAPMVARLPQKLLCHPQGGALAVLGHIDMAWAYSFQSGNKSQPGDYRIILNRLMKGDRIGRATDRLNSRWAQLSCDIAEKLSDLQQGKKLSDEEMLNLADGWVIRDDARNFVVLGDPAVKIRQDRLPVLG